MPWLKTGTHTHYNAKLRLPDKGRAIKGLVVCYVVWLGSIKWVFGAAQGVSLVSCCGKDDYQAPVSQHPIDTFRYNTIHYQMQQLWR